MCKSARQWSGGGYIACAMQGIPWCLCTAFELGGGGVGWRPEKIKENLKKIKENLKEIKGNLKKTKGKLKENQRKPKENQRKT